MPNLRTIRRLLIDDCNLLIENLQKASEQFHLGRAQQAVSAAMVSPSGGASTAGTARTVSIIVGQSVPELCQLTHAILIQEWHIFLDSIFKEAVLHYLKKKQSDKLPKIRLQLAKLDLQKTSTLRESISEEATVAFSSMSYEIRLSKLRKLLNISPDENLKVKMNNHRLIRNCFQHNRGIIRPRDLPACGFFELVNDKGEKVKYKEGQQLALSQTDVIELNKIIKDLSQEFEVTL